MENKYETPASYVATKWKWFLVFFAANSLIMGLAFKIPQINSIRGEYIISLFKLRFIGQILLSASKSVSYCVTSLPCRSYSGFFSIMMLYMSVSVTCFMILVLIVFLRSKSVLMRTDKSITIAITAFVALLNFYVTNYASGKVTIIGVNLTSVDGSGYFILGNIFIITLAMFSATITVLNIAVLIIQASTHRRETDV